MSLYPKSGRNDKKKDSSAHGGAVSNCRWNGWNDTMPSGEVTSTWALKLL